MRFPGANFAVIPLATLVACSPVLDWREVQPEGGGLVAMFPCKADRYARGVMVGGTSLRMEMHVCAAGGATYALSHVDVPNPAVVAATLTELRVVAAANLGGVGPHVVPLQISGMTPNAEASMLSISGKLPDGVAVRERAAFFAKGLRVYQASVIGANPPADAVDTFFSGLRFPT